MRPRAVVLIIIAIIILFAVSRLFSPKPDASLSPPQTSTPSVEKTWVEYTSPSKRFSVRLPQMPQRVSGVKPMPTATEEIQYDTFLTTRSFQRQRAELFL